MAEHLEIEQKFDVDADFERPDFAAIGAWLPGDRGRRISAASPVLHRLSATYFDTPDGRLAASRITLRRRTGGPDAGWHLKLPAGAVLAGKPVTRREVHAPLAEGGGSEVPGDLAARVAEITGGLPLAPIATLDTERTVVTLTGHDGAVLAEIADDVVTARRLTAAPGAEMAGAETAGTEMAAMARPPVRWREVEVEVVAADPELQRAAADLLLAAGARPSGHGSKLGRALSAGDG